MKESGLEGYRFSISWSWLIPGGRGKINPKDLEFYNNFINELISHGIDPHVTLLHFDTSQVLDDEYESWLNPKILDDFTAYANVCFREFGDRVTHWVTINEANQKGFIGLNVLVFNFLPVTNSDEDLDVKSRAFDFYSGWFIKPLVRGDYPKSMRVAAGNKIPIFTKSESKQLVKSFDFLGVNYYITLSVKNQPYDAPVDQRDVTADVGASLEGSFLQQMKGNSERNLMSSADGLQGVLEYMKETYGNPPVYIHENTIISRKHVSRRIRPAIETPPESRIWEIVRTTGENCISF